jgi:hypothetical protein
MKTQFVIDIATALSNGNMLASGKAIGPALTAGKIGVAQTPFGHVKIEVVSIGIIDLCRPKLPQQALQFKLIEGSGEALGGLTLDFE